MRLENVVEPAVTGMGYELVDVQSSNGGRLLRLFIDKPGGVTLGDCEAISRHMTRVLAVEGIDYDGKPIRQLIPQVPLPVIS